MKASGIIIIWACINVIRDTRVLGYVIDPYKHWDDSRPSYSNSGLQTKKVDGLNKPVVVLVPVDRNTNRDGTNEVDSKSITHPAHKTKRCKSLTPLRKVRLSAPLKEVNNDENFMNKNEVKFSMSKLRNIAPVDDEETGPMNDVSKPRLPKNIDCNDENYGENVALMGNRLYQDRKNKYFCCCIDRECAQNSPMKPSCQRNKNMLGPKLLQNTDLYSQLNALAAANSQETLGMKHEASRPIIATRKQGRKKPKVPKNNKCIPIFVATDSPMKIKLPLTVESNRRPMPSPAITNPYYRICNNYQSFQSALGIPNTSSLQECIRLHGRQFCTPPLAPLPQQQCQKKYYQNRLEDTLKPSIGYSSGDCQQNIPTGQYGVTTEIESSNYHQQHNSYSQFPVMNSKYTGYSDPGYDNYLEDQVKTGVVDSSTEYIIRLPDDDDTDNGKSLFDGYGDDEEEEFQIGRSNPQYAPDGAPDGENSGDSEVESRIESPKASQEDSPKLGQQNNVIVQPGYTHHVGVSDDKRSSSSVNAGNSDQENSAEGPVGPEAGVNDGTVENPLGASHDYEGRAKTPVIVEQSQATEGTLGAPEDEDGQSVPSTEEISSESPIIGKSYEPVTPSIHSSHPQEARQPAESSLTSIEDDETQPQIVGKPLNSQNSNDHTDMDKSEQQSIIETVTLGNSPTTYQSPRAIVQEYRKNHPLDQGNVGASNPESLDIHLSDESTEDPSRIHHLNSYDSTSAQPIMQQYMGGDYGQGQGSGKIPALGQSQAANGKKEGADNMVGSRISNPAYLEKITGLNSGPIHDIGDLKGTDLFYIGDGVKLPLTIKKLNDGSLALIISPKICENFVKQNCPCGIPKLGHILQERNDESRIDRRVDKKVHSRWIRSTTVHDDEITEKSMSDDDSPGVTVMPIEKFTKKYNLTLNLGDNEIGSWTSKDGKSGKTGKKLISNNSYGSMERNQYIRDLLEIHDASDTEETTTVINALDGISNGRKKSLEDAAYGFEYQLENPIMERIKYIKGEQLEHGRYKYQQSPDEAASARMKVAKNILHGMKELIVPPKANEIR